LMVLFLSLWAGSIFVTFPRCEDPLQPGMTLAWCDGLSIVVGLAVIAIFAVSIVCFIFVKMAISGAEKKLPSFLRFRGKRNEAASGGSKDVEMVELEWVRVVDTATGKPYLYHKKTGESKWIKNNNEKQNGENLSNEWTRIVDTSTGKPYMYHVKTGETKWIVDEHNKATISTTSSNPMYIPEAPTKDGNLNNEWTRLADPSTGKPYMYHVKTGETKWVVDHQDIISLSSINPLFEEEQKIFYMKIEDKDHGPYTESEMLLWYENGEIDQNIWCICNDGDWKMAKDLFGSGCGNP
jgi:hypothetical protein